jgi:hypothetical protein
MRILSIRVFQISRTNPKLSDKNYTLSQIKIRLIQFIEEKKASKRDFCWQIQPHTADSTRLWVLDVYFIYLKSAVIVNLLVSSIYMPSAET